MAKYCKQCSEEIFGKDFKDFVGETSIKDYAMGYATLCLCEGCGWIQVDPEGRCVSSHCKFHGDE